MIKATTTVSDNEFRIFLKYHLIKEKVMVKYAIPAILFIVVIIGAQFSRERAFNGWVLVSVMVLLALPVFVKYLIFKGFRKNPSYNTIVNWEMDEIELRGSGVEFSLSLQWRFLYEAYVTSEGILLYPQRHMFYWIPRSGFESDSDFNRTVDLLSRRSRKLVISKDFEQCCG